VDVEESEAKSTDQAAHRLAYIDAVYNVSSTLDSARIFVLLASLIIVC
jgi:hypothetical protein